MSERRIKNDLIDKFLKEDLSDEELTLFKEYWETDPSFVKEVRDYSRLKVAVKAAIKVKHKHAFNFKLGPFVKKAFFKYQSVAAVMLMAVMLPLYLLLQGQKVALTPDSPEVIWLAKSNFDTDRLNDYLNALSLSDESISEDILMQFIDQLKSNEMNDASEYYLLADMYFKINQTHLARQFYEQGLAVDPNDENAHWNLLMSQLATGDLIEVKMRLNSMASDANSLHQLKARELLLKLD